jgi:hypothetical protein
VSAPLRANAPDGDTHYDALMRPEQLDVEWATPGWT